MVCPKCGQEIPDGSNFCGSCGTSFIKKQKNTEKILKGNFIERINETLLAMIVYLLAIVGSTSSIIFMFIFTTLIQSNKDNQDCWLKKQCLQALSLSLIPDLTSSILKGFNFLGVIPIVGTVTNTIISLIVVIVTALCIVMAIICAVKSGKKEDINIPVIGKKINQYFN